MKKQNLDPVDFAGKIDLKEESGGVPVIKRPQTAGVRANRIDEPVNDLMENDAQNDQDIQDNNK